MRSFLGRDILSLGDFERADFLHVFEVADSFRARSRSNGDLLKHKTLITAFYQASTRTRMSTEAAMHRLGGHVLGFADAKMTRAGDFYQESVRDVVHMLECYGDVIAMRHPETGAPAEAAKFASVPIINCGDGWGEHPTQVLGDLYTLWRERGSLDGLSVLCVGDMRMRTMHSILLGMSQFDIQAIVVSPPEVSLLPDFSAELRRRGLVYREAESIEAGMADVDLIYMETIVNPSYLKPREDRPADAGLTPEAYRVSPELLAKAKRNVIVMHSLPRMDELPVEVDVTRHNRYWDEAFNCLVVRMALLALVLGAVD